jgi:hypothetical protein
MKHGTMISLKAAQPAIESDVKALIDLQAKIIEGQNVVMGRAQWTQNIILLMTVVAFSVGVLLVIIAIVQLVMQQNPVLSGLSAAGGLGTVLGTLLYKPMQRAQKSMGDLAQVQLAFLSFSSKVTIWTVYVRTRVVPDSPAGVLEEEKVLKITKDIETAAVKALQQIERYCEPKPKKPEPKTKANEEASP